MGRIGAAVALAMLLAASISADGPIWKYNERINELDDSVWRYVLASSNSADWFAVVSCHHEKTIVLWWNKAVVKTTMVARFRFDKGQVVDHNIGYGENARSIYFVEDGLVESLMENVLLRIRLPAELTGASVSTVLRLDLLDFNQARERCPEATNDEG